MKRKTILFFDHTARLGGGEIALFNLVRALDYSRYLPVVVLGANGRFQEKLCNAGIETHVIPLDPTIGETRKETLGLRSTLRAPMLLGLAVYCWKLAAFIKQRRVDALHTNSLKADLLGALSARLAGVRLIWHVRDRIDRDYLPAPAAKAFRWFCRVLPDYVIANSAATMASLGMKAGRRQSVVHDGVSEVSPSVSSAATQPMIVGLVGRIAPWKGQQVFLQAAHLVRQRFPNVRYQIIGSAMFGEETYERELRALTSSLGLDDVLEFTGFLENVREAIGRLELLVHASITGEPFGQVVTEGMALGKPIVATNGGGIPEIVKHLRTGLLVSMGSAEEMAKAILWLLEDPMRARLMGEAGRERVHEHFMISQTAREIERVYDGLCIDRY
jgi:glycosyltransferase involved in cell wall biosynthesis